MGQKSRGYVYSTLNDYIIPKLKNSSTFDPNTYVEYLGEKYPLKIYGPYVFGSHDECIELLEKEELALGKLWNKVYHSAQGTNFIPRELLSRGNKYYKTNESDFNRFYDWLDEFHQRYVEKEITEMIIFPISCFQTVFTTVVNKISRQLIIRVMLIVKLRLRNYLVEMERTL